MKPIKLLCIHGIGGQDASMDPTFGWVHDWKNIFRSNLHIADDAHFEFMKFDSFFIPYNADFFDYAKIFSQAFFDRKRRKGYIKDILDNYPDMVAEFLLEKQLRADLRKELQVTIAKHQPDVIYAHSLGSIMCYDFFSHPDHISGYENITLITSGSQLGNKYLQKFIASPLSVPNIRSWFNLNNPNDLVLAGNGLGLDAPKFIELQTEFSTLTGHDAVEYIKHRSCQSMWSTILAQ